LIGKLLHYLQSSNLSWRVFFGNFWGGQGGFNAQLAIIFLLRFICHQDTRKTLNLVLGNYTMPYSSTNLRGGQIDFRVCKEEKL